MTGDWREDRERCSYLFWEVAIALSLSFALSRARSDSLGEAAGRRSRGSRNRGFGVGPGHGGVLQEGLGRGDRINVRRLSEQWTTWSSTQLIKNTSDRARWPLVYDLLE